MDIGTGKDLDDYIVETANGSVAIPHHLIDICAAGERYNVFRFQNDSLQVYTDIIARHRCPIMCGGSGLYIESVLRGYRMQDVPQNDALRARLDGMTLSELTSLLATYKQLHNTTDVDTPKRAIRAIEIAEYYRSHPVDERPFPKLQSIVFGVDVSRELRRERISDRLRRRLDDGMIDEVRSLLESLSPDDLIYYGLEYKFLTLYIIGHLTYDEMVRQLEIAIHQFAKRQMTYFRGMERRGVHIHWIDGAMSMDDKVQTIINTLNEKQER